jgi:hypothetical protein
MIIMSPYLPLSPLNFAFSGHRWEAHLLDEEAIARVGMEKVESGVRLEGDKGTAYLLRHFRGIGIMSVRQARAFAFFPRSSGC